MNVKPLQQRRSLAVVVDHRRSAPSSEEGGDRVKAGFDLRVQKQKRVPRLQQRVVEAGDHSHAGLSQLRASERDEVTTALPAAIVRGECRARGADREAEPEADQGQVAARATSAPEA